MKPAKIRYLLTAFLLLHILLTQGQNRYSLSVVPVDRDSAFAQTVIQPKKEFINRDECAGYIQQLIPALQAKGYITASIDSVQSDSLHSTVHIFFGEIYQWASVHANEASRHWLSRVGWTPDQLTQQQYDPDKIVTLQQRMLEYMENNGYPFARIFLDSLQINGRDVSGRMNVHPGPLYHIDSIKVTGNAKISNEYLQQFLGIKNGSIYSKEKLAQISTELKKLNYVTEEFPPQLIWGSTGATIEVFLQQKKSSQVNIIIGFLPNSDASANRKMLITGEGLLNLKNAFGAGETIGLTWQRLQAASQRLSMNYDQPYLFKSPLGVDFGFNMLKRDSAFLNFDIRLGAQLALNRQQRVKLYVQRFSSILNYISESAVIATRKLPEEADVKITNLGIEYVLNSTNYIFNPVSGLELLFNTSVGNKNIKPNNQIVDLEDPDDPDFDFASLYDTVKTKSYQVRSVLAAAKYFPIGKAARSTIKTAINGGYISGSNIFRNELFQIGGYRLLRGFDEQSQFLSQYGIGTLEYRYLIGENSYFNVFADGGWGKNAARGSNINYTYLSGGLGMAFETKVGLFNLAWAVGKRNDTQFNLRQSKIHFGFVNYF
ncbi:POTRA domain-containing protein [Niabella yanshanensis]|uniref:POTRA domain-containing protein n=1 Tax=Niabella yanshanensis TaxID=577386 RepID=A0ABZ0W357_9BACT|nr:POTRA domain-containing protein [Niabella yanshanensis]WQD37641.1 POTRA domain-containing protein [Niabella yanshanensis]